MERISALMQEDLDLRLAEANGSPIAISRRRSESTKALLTALLELAEARGESLSEVRMRVYLQGLAEYDVRDVAAAARQIGREQRGEYEPKFPELGTLIGRTKLARAERIRPPKWEPCGECLNGFVIVERDGHRAARDCRCKVAWRAARDAAIGMAA